MKTLFVDVDNICYEGVKSGSLCNSIGMLQEIKEYTNVEILEVYNDKDSNTDRNNETKTFHQCIQGIKVTNIKYDLGLISDFVENNVYDNIIITLFSVFMDKRDVKLLQLLRQMCKKLIINVNDILYVKYGQLDHEDAKIYKGILLDSQVITCSGFVRNNVLKDLGVESEVIYPLTNINTDTIEKTNDYITFINPIGLKGVEVFEQVAQIMPDKEFLVVCGWQESANYKAKTNNVKVIPFQKDILKVWSKTSILLALSIVPEAYCRVVTEALLNNCDVIGFNVGGLPEAACGMGYIIDPVNNYGSIIYPKLNREEVIEKAYEIKKIIENVSKEKRSRDEVLKFIGRQKQERSLKYRRIFCE